MFEENFLTTGVTIINLNVSRNCLEDKVCLKYLSQKVGDFYPPRHAAVDGKVERVGEVNAEVDNKNKPFREIIIKEICDAAKTVAIFHVYKV